MNTPMPPGAESKVNGIYYKRGAHGFYYRWDNRFQEWVRCDISRRDFRRGLFVKDDPDKTTAPPIRSKDSQRKKKTTTNKQRIYDALKQPGTAKDVCERTGLASFQVSPYLTDMTKCGMLVKYDYTSDNRIIFAQADGTNTNTAPASNGVSPSNRQRIRRALKEPGTVKQVCERTELKRNQVSPVLSSMVESGMLKKLGYAGKHTIYAQSDYTGRDVPVETVLQELLDEYTLVLDAARRAYDRTERALVKLQNKS